MNDPATPTLQHLAAAPHAPPSVGRIVHYLPASEGWRALHKDAACAAIITRVHANRPELVDLTVFPAGNMTPTCLEDVPLQSAENPKACWCWPPRA